MPLYQVVIKKSAEKEIASLPLHIIEKLYKLLDQLTFDARPGGVKKLSGHKNLYRLRLNDYRIIYSVEDDKLYIIILKVGHRKDVYKG